VDSFHEHPKADLLADFKKSLMKLLRKNQFVNPILNSFQITVNEYQIDHQLIEAFLYSMELDRERGMIN
jgi:hypothetical protein